MASFLNDFVRRSGVLYRGVREQVRAFAKEPPTGWSAYVTTRASVEALGEQLVMQPRYEDPRCLTRHELQVFSQGGEDGIQAEIFRRIGDGSRYFVEIGTGSGTETNTTFLLTLGWRGVWLEGSSASVEAGKRIFQRYIDASALRFGAHMVTSENVRDLLKQYDVPTEFDLLSVDIDMNTYYVWEALAEFRPRVVAVEYNASIPPAIDWRVPYDPEATWNGTMYMGASLKALELLGTRLGYVLVGCNLAGVNAFFVRRDLIGDHFLAPYTAERHYEPPRYWLHWRYGHAAGIE